MPTLNRNEKLKCEDCGCTLVKTQLDTGKIFLKKLFFCPDCKYFTYNPQKMSYHMAKKHAQPNVEK